MSAEEQPKPPQIDRLEWPSLVPAEAASVRSGDTREGESYDGADFSEVELDFTTFVSCSFTAAGSAARLCGGCTSPSAH